jgi:hypothetical protein
VGGARVVGEDGDAWVRLVRRGSVLMIRIDLRRASTGGKAYFTRAGEGPTMP